METRIYVPEWGTLTETEKRCCLEEAQSFMIAQTDERIIERLDGARLLAYEELSDAEREMLERSIGEMRSKSFGACCGGITVPQVAPVLYLLNQIKIARDELKTKTQEWGCSSA